MTGNLPVKLFALSSWKVRDGITYAGRNDQCVVQDITDCGRSCMRYQFC